MTDVLPDIEIVSGSVLQDRPYAACDTDAAMTKSFDKHIQKEDSSGIPQDDIDIGRTKKWMATM